VVADLPELFRYPDTCMTAEIDGAPGNKTFPTFSFQIYVYSMFDFYSSAIVTRLGFYLNLDTLEWARMPGKNSALTFNPVANPVNSMFSFHGKPTVFGDLECMDNANCVYTAVKQYRPEEGGWIKIGQLKESR